MHKHFYTALTALAICVFAGFAELTSIAAVKETAVDTITLESDAAGNDEVQVDLTWKTRQDKGKWIEEMGIAQDANSLVLVLNNLENGAEEEIPTQNAEVPKARIPRNRVVGNSRLTYFSKGADEEWREVFSINCFISGGAGEDQDIYGAYRLESAFGMEENPGSLVPYHHLTSKDYWITDPEESGFGSIYTVGRTGPRVENSIKLEDMKAFSNYGMIIKPETEGEAYPALVINCQQADTNDRTLCGVQLSQTYVRMLIQSIDTNTRILIGRELEDLEGM